MLHNAPTAGKVSPSEQRPKFARMPSVLRFTGLGRSTIYRMIAAKEFPRPVKLGPRAVGWRGSDLDTWSETRSPPRRDGPGHLGHPQATNETSRSSPV